MDSTQIIGLCLVPIVLAVSLKHPQIILYYLVIDSWLIIRISSASYLLPQLSLNRIVVFIGLFIILGQRLFRKRLVPKSAKSIITMTVTLFLCYCLWSYYRYSQELNFEIIGNLIFYFLALALLEKDIEKTFFYICIIAIIPTFLLSSTSILNSISAGDIGQGSFAGNRNHSALYTIFGICFLFALKEILNAKKAKKTFVNIILLTGAFAVIISLGRLVTFILIIIFAYYYFKNYMSRKIIIVFSVLVGLLALTQIDLIANYSKKLMRFSSVGKYNVLKYSEHEMGAFTSGRSQAYKSAWEIFFKYPLSGIGYRRWQHMHKNYPGSSLHSTWLQVLLENGITGFFLYSLLYLFSFIYLKKARISEKRINGKTLMHDTFLACMIIFILAGTTGNHGFGDRIFYLFLAMIATLRVGRSQQRVPHNNF